MPEGMDVVELREKLSRAAQLLLFRHHIQPGAKGWELRKALGRDYAQILKLLDGELEKLGLTVKKVSEGEESSESDRYFVTLRGAPQALGRADVRVAQELRHAGGIRPLINAGRERGLAKALRNQS